MSVNDKEIAAVSALSRDKRLNYFIKRVADFYRIWGIDDAGWVLAATKEETEVFQVWPFPEFATPCCTGEWAGCVPQSIDLDDFMESYLPDFREKGILLGVFYTPAENGVLLTADELRDLLEAELENY